MSEAKRLASIGPGQGRRILSHLSPHRRLGVLAILSAFGGSLLGLIPALIIRSLIDDLDRSHSGLGHVGLLIALGVVAVVVSGLLNVAETYLTLQISKGVVAGLRGQLFDRLLQQTVAYHTRSRSGELMSRVLNDVGGIDDMIGSTMLNLISATCTIVASLALMIFLSWELTLVALLMFPLLAVVLRLAGRSIYFRRLAVQEQLARITSYLQEILGPSGITLIKSLGRESHERTRFAEANNEMRRLEVQSGMAGQWLTLVLSVLRLLGPVALLLIGANLVLHRTISLGTLVAFAAVAAAGFGGGLQSLTRTITAIISSLPLWARIFGIIDEPIEVAESPTAYQIGPVHGAVDFDGVTFSYAGQSRPALRDLSVSIAPGQLVALVGPSGAGKTTFSNLVCRFYDPQEGHVRLDGHDLRDLALSSMSAAVGLVLQETYLFHASIRDNLLYGRPDATETELDAAVHHAVLDDVISDLPDGYDTMVGERGYRLSGGEKQRMSIARIILKDPAVLILDEATSHLDSASEQLVQAALTGLFRHRTSLVIAHRLSTIRAADLILVLDKGRIVERGTHEELRHANGLYASLYDIQFRPTG